ncbi:hotdog fold thioesterase [Streptomyces sp. NBC_00249]|uniref:hotdog fold domain-containing protein n=1 Tax=Streptomyces sp. NBC_00249 TaxID=2975690 RepID=UPI002252AE69|nr:hotdog fold domain-containing protein [Streptomyces sp. NBC_00249]MCX5198503.1 hotdog fold thioesterase [Streptomyces sp. NBC_00249]
MDSIEMITVPETLHGYPGVAFGGYVAGLLAARTPAAETGAVRVDFRRPVPTGTAVRAAPGPDGGTELLGRDGVLLAAATPVPAPAGEVPPAPTWAEASKAADAYRADPPAGESPDCFGCGLDRTAATGLRLHCGTVPGRDIVATAWTPGPELATEDGLLPPVLVWGALDCPGNAAGRLLDPGPPGAFTAALTARLLRPVPAGGGLISYAWLLGVEGRKVRVGTALATAEGELRAHAEALWVRPRP